MDLGRADIVLHVDSLEKSHKFYELLGFRIAETFESGDYGERGSVIEHEHLRLHLVEEWFGERHDNPLTWHGGGRLCFRPKDMSKTLPELKERFGALGEVTRDGKAFDIQDPDGNGIVIWEDTSNVPAAEQESAPKNDLGINRVHIILNVQNLDDSLRFYEKLGFKDIGSFGLERYREIETEQIRLVLIQQWIGSNMFNFVADDMTQTLPKLTQRFNDQVVKELGLPRPGEVMHEGKAFDIPDPDGNDIYFWPDDH